MLGMHSMGFSCFTGFCRVMLCMSTACRREVSVSPDGWAWVSVRHICVLYQNE